MRQNFVFDLDELQRLACNRLAGRRHRRDRMPVIERLLARDHVAGKIAEIDHHLTDGNEFARHLREVVACNDRFHPGQRFGSRRVDRLDPRVRVRTPEHHAVELAWQIDVGAKSRPAGHPVHAVRTDRPRTDDLGRLLLELEHRRHVSAPPHFRCGIEHGLDDLVVPRTAAQIASKPIAHFGFAGIGIAFQKRARRD